MRKISTLLILLYAFSSKAQFDYPCGCGLVNNFKRQQSQNDTGYKVDLQKGLKGKQSALNVTSVKKDTTRIRLRCGYRDQNNFKPLLVVDGEILDLGKLAEINPHDIDSVNILKGPVASAIYGIQAANGVILICTKIPRIIVRDKSGPLAFATIVLKGTSQGIVTNEKGFAKMDKFLKQVGKQFEVSYVGYKSQVIELSKGSHVVELESFINTYKPVVVTAGFSTRRGCCRMGCCCWVRKKEVTLARQPGITINSYKVYPSPVLRGQTITIEIHGKLEIDIDLRIISLDGRTVFQTTAQAVKGLNRFQIPTDSRWSAGIYFMQFSDPLHHRMEQQKIILQ